MNTKLYDIIYDAVAGTLEGMAFIEVNRCHDQDIDFAKQDTLEACLDIINPVQGVVTMTFAMDLAKEITTDIFCLDEEPAEKMVHDAVGELLNTVAGILMSSVLPDDSTFELGLPVIKGCGKQCEEESQTFCFEINGQILLVALQGQGLLEAYEASSAE